MTNGMPVTVTRAAEELRKYRHGLKVMSGGLTVSGGEPLMQHRFVVKVFAAAKMMGVTPRWTPTAITATASPTLISTSSISSCSTSSRRIPNANDA